MILEIFDMLNGKTELLPELEKIHLTIEPVRLTAWI